MIPSTIRAVVPAQSATALEYLYLTLRTRLDEVKRDDRGASAVEWAVIAGVCVVLAAGIALVITTVVNNGKNKITSNDPNK
jgi:Flp pilus assembly pilin Flp